jgi:hypothetical protein
MFSANKGLIFSLAVLSWAVSGCGAVEGAIEDRIGDEDDRASRGPVAFDDLETELFDLESRISTTDTTNMPSGGEASFEGIALMSLPNPFLLSRVTLQADFDAGTIGGTFSDFERSSGAQIEGTLAISNGAISGNTLSFDLDGVLSGAVDGVVDASSQNATFKGDGAQGVDGDLTGTFTGTGFPATSINGRFLAERTP